MRITPSARKLEPAAGAVRETIRAVRTPVLAILAAAALCGRSAARPAPAPGEPPAGDAAQPAPGAVAPAAAPGQALPPASFGPPSQLEVAPAEPPRPEGGRQLSERTALGLSLGITLASWTAIYIDSREPEGGTLAKLGLIGVLAGPSVGHWYRGAILTRGMLPRVLGTAAIAFGIALGSGCEGECNAVDRIVMSGLALILIGTADDIVTAPLRVRAHNRRLQGVSLAPMVAPRSAGVALGGRF
jgi:hypothetical protein